MQTNKLWQSVTSCDNSLKNCIYINYLNKEHMKKLMLTIAMLFTLTCATTVSAQDIQQDLLTKEQLKAHKAAEKALKKI